jgi:hypothetical protein
MIFWTQDIYGTGMAQETTNQKGVLIKQKGTSINQTCCGQPLEAYGDFATMVVLFLFCYLR